MRENRDDDLSVYFEYNEIMNAGKGRYYSSMRKKLSLQRWKGGKKKKDFIEIEKADCKSVSENQMAFLLLKETQLDECSYLSDDILF